MNYTNQIVKDPELAYFYARDVLKSRWPEAEPYIMGNLHWAFNYARHVIKERWIDAEPMLMRSTEYAWHYAREVLKERWIDAEAFILDDPDSEDYRNYFKI